MRELILGGTIVFALAGCLPPANLGDAGSSTNDTGARIGDLASMLATDLSAATPDMSESPDLTTPSPCAGIAFCETFESYTAEMLTNSTKLGQWGVSIGGTGTVGKIDGVKVYGGKNALHVTMPAGASASVTLKSTTVTAGLVTGNDLFGRAMVWYANASGDELPMGHSEIFNAYGDSQASGGNVSMNVASTVSGSDPTMSNTFFNYHPATTSELSSSGGSITSGAWHCMQWEYGPTNEAKLWIDSKQVLDVAPSVGWKFATPWTSFDFGLTHYQATTSTIDFYMDDFAINGSMIACPSSS